MITYNMDLQLFCLDISYDTIYDTCKLTCNVLKRNCVIKIGMWRHFFCDTSLTYTWKPKKRPYMASNVCVSVLNLVHSAKTQQLYFPYFILVNVGIFFAPGCNVLWYERRGNVRDASFPRSAPLEVVGWTALHCCCVSPV